MEVALIVVVLLVAGMMLGDNKAPRYQISGNVEQDFVFPGGIIVFRWQFEMLRDCPGWTTRRLILPNRVVPLPRLEWEIQGYAWSELPRFHTVEVIAHLPNEDVEAGQAYYDIDGYYICNPLHNLWPLHVDFPPIPFIIEVSSSDFLD